PTPEVPEGVDRGRSPGPMDDNKGLAGSSGSYDTDPSQGTTYAPAPLADWAAAALVFGSSAAVLVVELVALRLLAPYLGLTLETSTLVIGVALAAIAFGSWVGGFWADRVNPRATLAPLLAISA